MPPYNFRAQNAIGVEGEVILDHFFRHIYQVTEATPEQQSFGIDRWFWDRSDALPFAVGYKTDRRAAKTDNAFIELRHTDRHDRSGWAYTSRAHVLVYYVPGRDADQAYWILFADLRLALPGWLTKYRTAAVPNRNYQTVGLVVPLRELECVATHVHHP